MPPASQICVFLPFCRKIGQELGFKWLFSGVGYMGPSSAPGATAMAGGWSGHKLKHVKLRLNVCKHVGFFAVGVAGQWDRWPREAVGSPSVEILKAQPDSRLRAALLDFKRSCPASATCDLCTHGLVQVLLL